MRKEIDDLDLQNNCKSPFLCGTLYKKLKMSIVSLDLIKKKTAV